MELLGAFVGALVATMVVSRALLFVLPKRDGREIAAFVLSLAACWTRIVDPFGDQPDSGDVRDPFVLEWAHGIEPREHGSIVNGLTPAAAKPIRADTRASSAGWFVLVSARPGN